jgi:hypothetical protein
MTSCIKAEEEEVFYGTQYDLYDRLKKGLVCNRKGPICKDLAVEINSTRLVFLSCRTVVFKSRMSSIRVLSKI